MGRTLNRGEVPGGLVVDLLAGLLDLALMRLVGIDASCQRLRQGDEYLGPGHGSTTGKLSHALRAVLYDARLAAPGRVASRTARMQLTAVGHWPGAAQAARAACESWPR